VSVWRSPMFLLEFFVCWMIEIMSLLFQIESMSSYELVGVGVTEPDVSMKEFYVGWVPGTLGYHADNGQYVPSLKL